MSSYHHQILTDFLILLHALKIKQVRGIMPYSERVKIVDNFLHLYRLGLHDNRFDK